MSERVDFDDYSKNYDDLLREKTGFFSDNDRYFAEYKVAITRKLVTRKVARILEYGCGIGRNIPYLRETFPGCEIIGSDISQASLAIAQEAQPETTFFLETNETPTLDKFDLIFVAGVYHHIPRQDRAAVSVTLRERLVQNGDIIVFEHNPYNPVTRRIVSTCEYDTDAVLLAPGELKQNLMQAGCRVEDSQYCLFIPPRLSALHWLEPKLGWLPMGGQYYVHAKAL